MKRFIMCIKSLFSSNNITYIEENSIMGKTNENENENVKICKEKPSDFCGFCRQKEHNINTCALLQNEFSKIEEYCSIYNNQINLSETRLWLKNNIDNNAMKLYVSEYKILSFMYKNCSEYYDTYIEKVDKKNINIEAIISYLCVLKVNPTIKKKRKTINKEIL